MLLFADNTQKSSILTSLPNVMYWALYIEHLRDILIFLSYFFLLLFHYKYIKFIYIFYEIWIGLCRDFKVIFIEKIGDYNG